MVGSKCMGAGCAWSHSRAHLSIQGGARPPPQSSSLDSMVSEKFVIAAASFSLWVLERILGAPEHFGVGVGVMSDFQQSSGHSYRGISRKCSVSMASP